MSRVGLFFVLAACTPPTPAPSEPPVPTPVVPDPVEAQILTGVGLRDLRAEAEGMVSTAWLLNGEPSGVEGPVVPARRLYPGDVWTAEITLGDGDSVTVSHTVPEPLGGNVLVLLLDDVGVDKVGAYGWDTASPTPRLDALAAEGVRFTRAYASPVCSPTRGTIMTARQPRRTGLGWIADTGPRNIILPYESTTIPEALWEARGAETWADGAIGKWHMAGPNAPEWLMHPLDSGFSWFVGAPGNPQYASGRGYYNWTKNVNGVTEESDVYMTTDSVDEALDRISTMEEPWFLYVAFNAPHGPLDLPPSDLLAGPLPTFDAPRDVRYDAVLEALDTEIGRLLDSVDPDVLSRTTVLTMGDNGTSDAGVPNDVDLGRNKHTPYEGGIRVPFIATGPHVREPGRVSDALIHVADVLPTVADLAGIPLGGPDGEILETSVPVEIDGRSLLPHLLDPAAPGRARVYAEASGNGEPPNPIDIRAVQTARYKLVRYEGADEFYILTAPDYWDVTPAQLLTPTDLLVRDELTAYLDAVPETYPYEAF
jgi:arylsulfatase A-like enzyme